MTEVTLEMRQRAAGKCWKKLISDDYYFIDEIDKIAKVMDISTNLYFSDLSRFHCLAWSEMGHDMAEIVKEKTLHLLNVEFVQDNSGDRLVKKNNKYFSQFKKFFGL